MAKKILLTSFQTWLAHQPSNSSDDLLVNLQGETITGTDLTLMRRLPVDTIQASQRAIAAIENITPDVVICCGMAESRLQLTIESNALWENEQLETPIDLSSLIAELSHTNISYDAGKFVCEGLYYHVLNHLKRRHSQTPCIFVHVPVLTYHNLPEILSDFRTILEIVD